MIVAAAALPLIPDGDEARRWAEQELADPVYRVTEPTPFDRFARSVAQFLIDLFTGGFPAAAGPWLAVAALAAVALAVVLALLIWGRPRLAARSHRPLALFGETDERSAAQLRTAAAQAAAADDWEQAIILRFRGLARSLVERTVIDPAPGATVHRFARDATRAFPAEAAAWERVADTFDDVRYLRRPGTAAGYADVAALDDRVAAATPVLDAELLPSGAGA